MNKGTDRQTGRQAETDFRYTDRQAHSQAGRHADRQAGWQTIRETDIQTAETGYQASRFYKLQ
jgi:hypothetical protein